MRVRRFHVGKLVNKLKILIAVLLLYIYQYYNFAELIRFWLQITDGSDIWLIEHVPSFKWNIFQDRS